MALASSMLIGISFLEGGSVYDELVDDWGTGRSGPLTRTRPEFVAMSHHRRLSRDLSTLCKNLSASQRTVD
jgi:hypothetical protein